MRLFRTALPMAMCVTAFAQAAFAQTPEPEKPQIEIGQPIKVTTTNVVAPVLVTDKQGNIVDGLQPNQFHLWDNGKEQNIQVDTTYEPISLVIAIECSARVESILPQIKHLGSLVQTIIGRQGEAAVIKFDGRLITMQDFTNDPDKVKVAINKITAGNSGTRMIDAVDRSVFMLRNKPAGNRRIVLLVSETRDEGSETRLREALIRANLTNVLIYTVDISQIAVRFTEKPPDPGPTRRDPTAQNNPMGVPNTPTTMDQNFGMGNRVQFIPLLKEIYIDAKGIFIKDPATQFARATGGREFTFLKQKGLEEAVQRIGTEIRSHYMISYSPNNQDEGGYHTIEVRIDRSAEYICKTRPGYWLGGGSK